MPIIIALEVLGTPRCAIVFRNRNRRKFGDELRIGQFPIVYHGGFFARTHEAQERYKTSEAPDGSPLFRPRMIPIEVHTFAEMDRSREGLRKSTPPRIIHNGRENLRDYH